MKKQMKLWGLAGMVALCTCATTVEAASPSYMGTTGSFMTPSAEVVSQGNVSLSYWHSTDGDHKMGTVGFGIAPNVEVSVAHQWSTDKATIISGKYGLVKEGLAMPAVAIGLIDATDEWDQTVYMAATKNLPFGFKATIGYGNGMYDGVFGSVEKTISLIPGGDDLFPATTLVVEYDAHDWNYGARLAIAAGAKLTIGRFDDRTYIGATFAQ